MNSLKRETTSANRNPDASSLPTVSGTSDSAGNSSFNFFPVFSVSSAPLWWIVRFATAMAAKKLFTLELRLPLLQKCRRSFSLIFCRAAHTEQHGFQVQAFVKRHLHAAVHGLHGVL